jgi:nitroreductase
MSNTRHPDYPVEPLFINRWSPRAFTGETIADETLFTFFEAARWAASSFNSQPWRYIYAKNDSPHWADFLNFLTEFNRGWASSASVLIVALSKTTFVPPGKDQAIAMSSHAFDAGAAWANLALQTHLSGWAAHGIGGFDPQLTRETLAIPDNFSIQTLIAIGKPSNDISQLPASLQAKETPSPRKPITDFIRAGHFSFTE